MFVPLQPEKKWGPHVIFNTAAEEVAKKAKVILNFAGSPYADKARLEKDRPPDCGLRKNGETW